MAVIEMFVVEWHTCDKERLVRSMPPENPSPRVHWAVLTGMSACIKRSFSDSAAVFVQATCS